MKKKNVMGHMTLPKEKRVSWFRRSALIPRLLCLLLAVLIWLIVSSVDPSFGTEMPSNSVETAVTAEQ